MNTTGTVTETWLREALVRLGEELQLFAHTFTAFTLRPGRAARDWQSADRTFMNPLAFAATAAGIYWATTSTFAALWPIGSERGGETLAEQFTTAVGPYLHYGLLGVAMHVALRALGSPRRILGSIGAAFFAGGSVGTLGALLLTTTARWYGHTQNTNALEIGAGIIPAIVFIGAILFYLLVCITIARALRALHHVVVWKVVVAGAFALIITAFLFGSVVPDGNYGWHPYIRIERDASGLGLAFGFEG